ncbi:H-NS family nucleoid-associated regulatory protein [Paraburkholderia kirstenboschensis]|uniref:H-NS family nucleoid-associated regulatory protein n=1 Tax=Paraburkholderia kirstenboschensis TaxID=1245436 RepID=UPI000B250517
MNGRIVDGEARDRLIQWIRRRMEEFGITPQALADSIQRDLDQPPLYRDARGNEWNGVGDTPQWLRAAQNAGVDPCFSGLDRILHPSSRPAGLMAMSLIHAN